MLVAANITMQFGAKPLFENVNVKFGEGYPLRPDRRQRGRQVDLHEDPVRRAGAVGRQRFEGKARAHGLPAPGSVRLRRHARARCRAHGPRGNVGLHAGTRRHLRQSRGDRRRLHEGGRPRAPFRGIRRLYRRIARRRTAARRRHPDRPARRPDERGRAGLEAARPALPGAVRQPGHPAARRADQQPRHQHHPLAGRHAQRARVDDDHHLARPPLPEPGLHPHGRPRLRQDHDLSGQLRRLHGGLDAGPRTPVERQCQGQGTHRRAADLRPPLLGQCLEGQAGDQPDEADRQAEAGRRQAVVAPVSVDSFRLRREGQAAPPGGRGRQHLLRLRGFRAQDFQQPELHHQRRRTHCGDRRKRRRQDDAAQAADERSAAAVRRNPLGGKSQAGLLLAGSLGICSSPRPA